MIEATSSGLTARASSSNRPGVGGRGLAPLGHDLGQGQHARRGRLGGHGDEVPDAGQVVPDGLDLLPLQGVADDHDPWRRSR